MSIRWIIAPALGLIVSVSAAQDTTTLKDQKEKLSYALGMDLGIQLRKQSIEVDPDILFRALKDGLSGGKTLMTEADARAAISALQAEMMKKMAEAKIALGEKNKTEGEAFLAENKTKEGVITLPSGLQYKILKEGSGKKPALDDTVVCNYRGTLIDGTEFDSSYKRNQAASFPVKGVIKGWTEALQLMQEGSKWQLFIPSNLAYGENGMGNVIPPNSTLIFEVELISIKAKP